MAEQLCEAMQVVVLMGGLGSRLGDRTMDTPKSMVRILGKPFFAYQLELMMLAGFKKFLFCVGYRAERIEEYFGDGSRWGVEIRYSIDGERLLGTGGAVRKALPLLEKDFFLIYGDSFMDINYLEVVVRYHNGIRKGKRALMTVMHNEGRLEKSNVVCKEGEIVLYDKGKTSPDMEYVDYGTNIFRREIFEAMPPDQSFDLSDVQHMLSLKGELACCEVEKRFYEIGRTESLQEFVRYATERWGERRKAVFLDRDGVLNELNWNEDTEQLDSPLKTEELVLVPGVADALKILQGKGYWLFIVTNQPGAAKGKTTYEALCAINHKLVREMRHAGVDIADVMMCPHYPERTSLTREEYLIRECGCRKPKTGMVSRILVKYNIDKGQSWMVGDSATDILCGKAAGLCAAFIGKYKCDLCMMAGNQKPDLICKSLEEFAGVVCVDKNPAEVQGENRMDMTKYIRNYLKETKQIADTLSVEEISRVTAILRDIKRSNGRLFILGIGGSAANASHAVNDFRKIAGIETYAPTDNVSELTARTNDEGWDTTFSEWLKVSRISASDAVLVLSVGGGTEGTSQNIVGALKMSKECGAKIIGIVSRDGGYTKTVADACVLIPVMDDARITPHAEGWQGVIWHLLVNALNCEETE